MARGNGQDASTMRTMANLTSAMSRLQTRLSSKSKGVSEHSVVGDVVEITQVTSPGVAPSPLIVPMMPSSHGVAFARLQPAIVWTIQLDSRQPVETRDG